MVDGYFVDEWGVGEEGWNVFDCQVMVCVDIQVCCFGGFGCCNNFVQFFFGFVRGVEVGFIGVGVDFNLFGIQLGSLCGCSWVWIVEQGYGDGLFVCSGNCGFQCVGIG